MSGLNRRQFLAGATAIAAVPVSAPRVHAQKKGGTLRFVPHAELRQLDPMATTAPVTRNHAFMAYDTLFGTDAELAVKPQMVEKFASTDNGRRWSFTLRDGLRFHDGQPVTAEDAVESLRRWSRRDPLGGLLAAQTSQLAAVDRKTFTLERSQPFGPVLEVLGTSSSHVPFQRLAYEEVTYVPFGQWVLPTAHRKRVSGMLEFSAPLFWNVAIG